MRLLDARGTAGEIGYAIGAAAPDLVAESVELVCRLDGLEGELDARLAVIERRLADTFPEVLDEAVGLATGAGISRRDALVLSVSSDLHGKLPGWCSLAAVPADGGVVVGKNLDTTEAMAAVQVVERLARDGARAFLHVTAAGAMWTDGGVNEDGLALVNSSLAAARPNPAGIPDGILARELLARCADVRSAIELASRYGMMTLGENLLLADATGRVAVIEKLPGGQSVREGTPAVACNHPLTQRLAALMSAEDPIRANSARRTEWLARATRGLARWSLDDLRAALADHAGGVCQHGADGLWTIASLIVAPASRRMWVADGPPCLAAHEEVMSTVEPRKGAQHVHEGR